MAIERIDSMFDIPTLNQEYNQFLGLTKGAKDSLMDLYNTTMQFKDSNIATLTENTQKLSVGMQGALDSTKKASAAYDDLTQKVSTQIKTTQEGISVMNQYTGSSDALSKQLIRNKITNDDLVRSQKELAKGYSDGRVSLQQYENGLSDIKAQQDALKNSNKEVTTTIKSQSDAYVALDAAYQKAAATAKTSGALAFTARKQATASGNPEDEQNAAKLSAQANVDAQKANALNTALKNIDSSVGESHRKVGDYTGALKVLESSLFEVNAKLQQLAASGEQGSKAYSDLSRQSELLNTLVGQQEKGFTSVTMEIRNAERALQTLRAEGFEGSEAFDKLRNSTAQAAQAQKEFAKQQQILESRSPILTSLTIAAKGLAGAYAIGASAASLLADGDEKVAKSINQLVAIMTLLQGLQQVAELIKDFGAIETAVEGATAATVEFSTVLTISGIGVAVVALVALYEILTSVGGEEKDAAEEAVKFDEAIQNLNKTLTEEADLLNTTNDDLKRKLQTELEYSEKNKGNYYEQYAIKKQIAAVDIAIAENNIKSISGSDDINEGYKKINANLEDQKKKLEEVAKTKEDLDRKANKSLHDQHEADPFNALQVFVNSRKTKNAQDAADAVDKQYDIEKKRYDDQKKLIIDYDNAQKNATGIEIDRAEFTAEEQVKITEQTEKLRAEAIIQVNEIILSNDRSTQAQRLKAEQTILSEQIKIIEAEKKAKLSDTSLTPAGRQQVENDSQAAITKATVAGAESRRKLIEDYRLRNLSAQTQYNKDQIEQTAATASAIYSNDKKTLDERLKAYSDYYDTQRALNDNELHQRLSAAGFSGKEIEAVKNGDKVRTEGKKITDDELLAIEADYNAKVVEINSKTQKNVNDIIVSWAKKNAEAVDAANKTTINSDATLKYNQDLSALNKSLEAKLISINQYNKAREHLDDQFRITQEAQNLESDQKSIDNLKANQKQIQSEIQKNSLDLVKSKEGGSQEEIDSAQATADALIQANIDANGKIKEADKKLADDQKALVEGSVKFYIQQKEQQTKIEIQFAQQAADSIASLVDDADERAINRLQKQIDLNNKLKEAETVRINNSTLSEQEKANELLILDKTAAAQNEALQKKQRDDKVKEAKFDRDVSVARIAATTAEAVLSLEANAAKALSEAAVLAANPITAAYAPIAAAAAASIQAQVGLTVALGAIQIASVLAKPIPTYFIGTDDHIGGLAKVHTGELVIEPNKNPFMTPDGETLMNLSAHTKVIPKSKIDAMVQNEMRVNRFGVLEYANQNNVEKKIDELKDVIIWQTRELKKTKPVRRTTINNIAIDNRFAQRISKSIYE